MEERDINRPIGNQLIFIISQPRAGSTMLQRILGNHPSIHTGSEPWLMLYPFYALRQKGYEAEFDAHIASVALKDFLSTLPHGENVYYEGVRRMYSYLYQQALIKSNKPFFLDKTPRYYFIIPELYRTFPDAHYIILLRNPMAVVCSILKTWVKKNWFKLERLKHDLCVAPHFLLKSAEQLGMNRIVVLYEDILRDPNNEIERICRWIGIDFSSEIIDYGYKDQCGWNLGDQNEIDKNLRPVLKYSDKWDKSLQNPQIWRITREYFSLLGGETFAQMGYSSKKIEETLEKHRPGLHRRLLTVSLSWLLKKPMEERRKYERIILRFVNLFLRKN